MLRHVASEATSAKELLSVTGGISLLKRRLDLAAQRARVCFLYGFLLHFRVPYYIAKYYSRILSPER